MILNVTTENLKDFVKLLCLHHFQPIVNAYNIILSQSEKLHASISLHRSTTNFKAYEPEM